MHLTTGLLVGVLMKREDLVTFRTVTLTSSYERCLQGHGREEQHHHFCPQDGTPFAELPSTPRTVEIPVLTPFGQALWDAYDESDSSVVFFPEFDFDESDLDDEDAPLLHRAVNEYECEVQDWLDDYTSETKAPIVRTDNDDLVFGIIVVNGENCSDFSTLDLDDIAKAFDDVHALRDKLGVFADRQVELFGIFGA